MRTLRQECRLSIIVQLEQSRPAFNLSLHKARRGDFEDVLLVVAGAERLERRRAEPEHAARILAAQDEMPKISLDGGIRFLFVRPTKKRMGQRNWGDPRRKGCEVHLIESVGKRIVSTRGRADGLPEIDDQFVAPWRSLSFGSRLQGADQLDGGLEGQC